MRKRDFEISCSILRFLSNNQIKRVYCFLDKVGLANQLIPRLLPRFEKERESGLFSCVLEENRPSLERLILKSKVFVNNVETFFCDQQKTKYLQYEKTLSFLEKKQQELRNRSIAAVSYIQGVSGPDERKNADIDRELKSMRLKNQFLYERFDYVEALYEVDQKKSRMVELLIYFALYVISIADILGDAIED